MSGVGDKQVKAGRMTEYEAQYNFEFDFGQNDAIYTIQDNKLYMPHIPPEPD